MSLRLATKSNVDNEDDEAKHHNPWIERPAKRARANTNAQTPAISKSYVECLEMIDRAIMMSPPHSRGSMQKMATAIHDMLVRRVELKPEPWGSSPLLACNSSIAREIKKDDGVDGVTRTGYLSLYEFERMAKGKKPFVITGGKIRSSLQ